MGAVTPLKLDSSTKLPAQLQAGDNGLVVGQATLDASGLTAARTLTLPDVSGKVVIDPSSGVVNALTISSGVVTVDCSLGDYFYLNLNQNVTSWTFTNVGSLGNGRTLAIRINQAPSGGPYTVAFPLAVFSPIGGTGSAVQTGANAPTLLALTTFTGATPFSYVLAAM